MGRNEKKWEDMERNLNKLEGNQKIWEGNGKNREK